MSIFDSDGRFIIIIQCIYQLYSIYIFQLLWLPAHASLPPMCLYSVKFILVPVKFSSADWAVLPLCLPILWESTVSDWWDTWPIHKPLSSNLWTKLYVILQLGSRGSSLTPCSPVPLVLTLLFVGSIQKLYVYG